LRVTRGNDPARAYDLKHPSDRPVAEDELPSTRALREEAVINLEAGGTLGRDDGGVRSRIEDGSARNLR
jgi:hypothetical protein